MDKLIEILSLEQYEQVILNKSILMFSADWCPDCIFIKPHMASLVDNNPEFVFYYVNRDTMIDLCKDLNVFGIPSFIAYDQGQEIGRLVNKNRKTKQEVQAFIDTLK